MKSPRRNSMRTVTSSAVLESLFSLRNIWWSTCAGIIAFLWTMRAWIGFYEREPRQLKGNNNTIRSTRHLFVLKRYFFKCLQQKRKATTLKICVFPFSGIKAEQAFYFYKTCRFNSTAVSLQLMNQNCGSTQVSLMILTAARYSSVPSPSGTDIYCKATELNCDGFVTEFMFFIWWTSTLNLRPLSTPCIKFSTSWTYMWGRQSTMISSQEEITHKNISW